MFNDKQQKTKRSISLFAMGAATLALAVTFSCVSIAQAHIQASVSKPALRTEYKDTNMINLDGAVNLSNGNRKISVSLRDSDLKQALRMIADKAGLNIIFHSSVEGTVTLDLVNVTLNDAFKMIMQASDLSYFIDNDTLLVMSKEASLKSDVGKKNMMTLPVKYADSAKIADFLNSNVFATNRPGLSNNKIVVTNPVTNELIIFGTKNDYLMAQRVVNKLDVQPRTISYRVNHTTPREMATLICDSLFPTAQKGGVAGNNGDDSQQNTDSSGNDNSGVLTGAASTLGGSNNSGSGSGGLSGGLSDSSSSGEVPEISLGEGKVACTIKGKVTANTLKSLEGSSLTVSYFPQKGTINIIGGSEAQAEMIKNFIKDNDKKQPQAFVEVQIVELSESGSKDFNNTWNLVSPFATLNFGKDGFGTGFTGNDTANPIFFAGKAYDVENIAASGGEGNNASNLMLANRRNHFTAVTWRINYLIKNGKGRLLANPKVMVTNGKKSLINLTSDYIKSTDEEILTSGLGTGVAGVSRTYETGDDCGISVELTPFISPDGYVTMNLKPNYATVKPNGEIHTTGNGGGDIVAVTLLQRRNLDLSNVRVKDGETLVLGGLIQETESKEVSKIPFLGDIPVIGSVFRNTNTKNEKSELVIMITPRIIKDTEDVASGEDL